MLSSPGFSLDRKTALHFLQLVETGFPCSYSVLTPFLGTELETPATSIFIDTCFEEGDFDEILKVRRIPKNPYIVAEYATALLIVKGDTSAVSKVFGSTNRLDEAILLNTLGRWNEVFEPSTLKRKVLMALTARDTDTAYVYLSRMSGEEAKLLRALLLAREGKRKEAIETLKELNTSKAHMYITYISKDPLEKLSSFSKAISGDISKQEKERLTIYILDNFLYKNKRWFKDALMIVKNHIPHLYKEYMIKKLVIDGNYHEALKELKGMKGTKYSAWKVAIYGKYLKKSVPFRGNDVNFYTLILNSSALPQPTNTGVEVKDPGLKLLYEAGRCDVIELMDGISLQLAEAQFLCGNYPKALKVARKLREKPLKVLYPAPAIFGRDILSLAVARQESMFKPRALSRSGAIGIMQIMPSTGRFIARKLGLNNFQPFKLFEPELNYRFGSYYLQRLVGEFHNIAVAVSAYNAGPSRIRKALKRFGAVESPYDLVIFTDFYLPFSETRDYVKKVLVNLYFYSNLYGEGKEWRTFYQTLKVPATAKTH